MPVADLTPEERTLRDQFAGLALVALITTPGEAPITLRLPSSRLMLSTSRKNILTSVELPELRDIYGDRLHGTASQLDG